MFRQLLLPFVVLIAAAPAAPHIVETFNDGWTFRRGPYNGLGEFVEVSIPHDFGWLDLPPRETDTSSPVLSIRNGDDWKFTYSDNPLYSTRDYNDTEWTTVSVPHDWRSLSHSSKNSTGWYRKKINSSLLTPEVLNSPNTRLALGTVSTADVTYLNGVQIGATGGDSYNCHDALIFRTYPIPLHLLDPSGDNTVAVRVHSSSDGTLPGGLYDSGAKDERKGPLDPGASVGEHSVGYAVFGEAWYKKKFKLAIDKTSTYRLEFDGVYMNATVYLNGKQVYAHPYGYTSFTFDITDALVNGENELDVAIYSMGRNSRWYPGSGIYRDVRLVTTSRVAEIAPYGVSVVPTQINVAERTATINVTVSLATQAPATSVIRVELLAEDGHVLAQSIISPQPTMTTAMPLKNITLWSPDTPQIYYANVYISSVLHASERFGVRHVDVSPTLGFKLNGKPLKLRGGCVHHANGPLGSRAFRAAEFRRVALLKKQGYNAIRTSHNPPSPAFVEACDRLGVMLMEEAFDCWEQGKNPQDYHNFFDEWWERDIESMVLRDRNRPSIVMWSIGNEIPMRATPKGAKLSAMLTQKVHDLDPIEGWGRRVTAAVPGVSSQDDAFFAPLDIAGYNYSPEQYLPDHKRFPDRIMVATESFPIDSLSNWQQVWNNTFVIGDFIWTAMDYIGEAAIGSNGYYPPDIEACEGSCQQGWSYYISYCGDLDVLGFEKPQGAFRRVLWDVSEVEMAVHAPIPKGKQEVVATWGWPDERRSWTWNEWNNVSYELMQVNVYTKHSEAELFLNGKSIAKESVHDMTATFHIPYSPGLLSAVAGDAKVEIGSAGKGKRLRLVPDRYDDLFYVRVEVVDSRGILSPEDAAHVSFHVSSPEMTILAAANADPTDVTESSSTTIKTFRGTALVIVHARTKDARGMLVATSADLSKAEVLLSRT